MTAAGKEGAVFTIGYGGRSCAELLDLLQQYEIETLVDVRSAPYSRSQPGFSRAALQAAVEARGLRYAFQGRRLGGRPEAPECYVAGKVDTDRLRRQQSFREGLDRLRRAHSQGMRVALLCAERRPEQCHRALLIGPELLALGVPVTHLDEDGLPRSQTEIAARLSTPQPALLAEGAPPAASSSATVRERPPSAEEPTSSDERAASNLAEAREVLARVFGYPEFRPVQDRIIANVLAGRDTLGIMPTGAGKSLCYQLPALLFPGLTVVVSPLISLMQDQVDQLVQFGVPAVTLNSALGRAAYQENARQVRAGEAKLLYVAPETLVRPEIRRLLGECGVSCFTIDEAHCISEWGHDFRPEYRQLRRVRDDCPRAVCLALTATATERVRRDIQSQLGIPPEQTYVAGFDRPNLRLEVRPRERGAAQVLEFLAGRPEESGIVYCSTREQVDTLARQLQEAGSLALPYHAGLEDAVRKENQRRFQRDEARVIVATVAFGMGINKSNVRFVLHHALPDCLETYYQQVGRAGRDGLRSDCLLLFARADIGTIHHFIQTGAEAERAGRMARLQAMVRYAEATRCRRRTLLTYFGDPPPAGPCGGCDNCLAEAAGRAPVDVSEDARLFLTCVKLTGQRFGPAHLVEILRGSQNARVERWRHDQLPVHGAGRHRSASAWRALADRFIEQELVEAEMEHGTLQLTDAGRRALDGEPVFAVLEEPQRAAPRPERHDHDPALFDALRRLRRELADEAGVPAYVVFSDRSLSEMAASCPRTPEEFLRVHGVGERKAAVYGEPFLETIRRHQEEQRPPTNA